MENKKENGPNDERKREELSEVVMSLARSHHERANNLIGMSIIILTFFWGLMVQVGGLGNIVFQVVTAFIVVDIALFWRASLYYSYFEHDFISGVDAQHARTDLGRADTSLLVALVSIQFTPALITLATGIYWVAALGLIISIFFVANVGREQRRHKVSTPSQGLRYLGS